MKRTFLSTGECMVEMAPTAVGDYSLGFAGDTLNTAWYARQLLDQEWGVSYLTAVGEDAISDRMVNFIAAAGIETDLVQKRSGCTVGLYLIQLDDGERSFAYWRSDSAARRLANDPARLEAAFAAAFLCLTVFTIAVTSMIFALILRNFYAQWHGDPLSKLWLVQFAFTTASALYQFAVMGIRLYLPLGVMFLFGASWLLANRHSPTKTRKSSLIT